MKITLNRLKMIFMILVFLMLPSISINAKEGLNVEKHTMEEIRNRIKNNPVSFEKPDVMDEDPLLTAPYRPGKVSEESLNDALTTLNHMRYIAGLQPVSLNRDYCEYAQAGSLLNAINGYISHWPYPPSDMDETLKEMGTEGAGSSNLAQGGYSLSSSIQSWLCDSDKDNISEVGHRRWVLSPSVAQAGFGNVNGYTSMYKKSSLKEDINYNITWPAQYMPTDYFGRGYAWSLGLGHATENVNQIHVKLTRQADGKTWNFSSSGADGDFYVRSMPEGYPEGAVIFRPTGIEKYINGDRFHVEITGLSEGDLEYDVEFFDLKPITKINIMSPEISMKPNQNIYLPGKDENGNPYYKTEPEDPSVNTLIWTSDNPEIAKINNEDHVVGVSPGNTTIRAKTLDGKVTASIAIHVHGYEYTKTENGLAHFTCSGCGDSYTGKVPVSFDVAWKYHGATGYSRDRIPKAILFNEYLEYYVVGEYGADSDLTLDDYLIEIQNVGSSTVTKTLQGDDTQKLKMNSRGTKTLTFYPKYNPELKKAFTFDVVDPLSDVSFSSDHADKAETGETVTFTATPQGGSGDYAYTYFALDENETKTILKRESKDNTFLWIPEKTGTYRIGVTVKDNKLEDFSVKPTAHPSITKNADPITVTASKVVLKEGSTVCSDPTLTYGEKIGSLSFASPVFVDANSNKEVRGTLSWDDPDTIPDAGKYQAKWTFTPTDSSYNAVHGTTDVTVKKAVPTVQELPVIRNLIYNPETTLKNIAIQNPGSNIRGSWEWVDQTIVPVCGNKKYKAVFTPESSNYSPVTKDLSVEMSPAEPYLSSVTCDKVEYGKTLWSSNLQGTAQYGRDNDYPVEGDFSWDNPNTVIKADGEHSYTFTPKDSVNYKSIQGKASVTVIKRNHPDNMPEGTIYVPNDIAEISQVLLKDYEGWAFKPGDVGKELKVDEPVACSVVYRGEDADAYETTETTISVCRNQCLHKNTKIINEKEAACTEDGYTGDTECEDCHTVIKKGNVIRAKGHVAEDLPEVPPTCTDTGLTKGQKCKVCGEILKEQSILPKTGHEYEEETVEPTCTEKGYVKHTCIHCNDTYKDQYKDALGHTEVIDPAVEATTTKTGLTEGSHCSVCNKVLKKQEVVPKIITEPSKPVFRTDANHPEVGTKEKQITSQRNDGDPKGSAYGLLCARVKKSAKTTNTIGWNRVSGASGYIIYGNRCGNAFRFVKIAEVRGTGFVHKGLKKGTYYKYLVVAYKNVSGGRIVVTTSKTMHAATTGGKVGNCKKLKLNKTKVTLKRKKTFKLKAKEVPVKKKLKIKRHRKIAFESSNPKIATVTSSGKIKGIKKGSCKIYVYAQNGVYKAVKVKVK